MQRIKEGDLLWKPSDKVRLGSNINIYMTWLRETRGLVFESYDDLWTWSVSQIEDFWASIWEFFQVNPFQTFSQVLENSHMPGACWFTDSQINYAEHALRRRDDHPAILFQSETLPLSEVSYRELYMKVSSIAAGLRQLGVKKGDRVAAYLPNIPNTIVAFLATTSIGAIWSSCSPEFGTRSVIERFQQIKPSILLTTDGYQYGGLYHPLIEKVAEIQKQLPTLKHTIVIPYLTQHLDLGTLKNSITWNELHTGQQDLDFEPVSFDHPLWILYSSGTTGLPKPIVHGHGGILLEHLKTLSLHLNLTNKDRFFWFTTTGWMMWNMLASGLLVGASILLYDGNPGYPDMSTLWRFAQETSMTYFGTGAPYIQACMKANIEPGKHFNLDNLKAIGSTAAPLPPEGFQWVYEKVKDDLLLGSFSGGTDLCTGFVGPCPLLPVYAGEIQCRCLGASVEAYDENGCTVNNQVGELMLTEPLPSMPLYFWNDSNDQRYKESYFEHFPGMWRHGDWVKITSRNTCIIYGRSDSTLNRGGVRMGTSEFYRVVEEFSEVADSLVIDTGELGNEGQLLLFLVLKKGTSLNVQLRNSINQALRSELSPRHIPQKIYAIPEVPRTLNGKKLEIPVKRILAGTPLNKASSQDAMSNPQSLEFFVDLAIDTEKQTS